MWVTVGQLGISSNSQKVKVNPGYKSIKIVGINHTQISEDLRLSMDPIFARMEDSFVKGTLSASLVFLLVNVYDVFENVYEIRLFLTGVSTGTGAGESIRLKSGSSIVSLLYNTFETFISAAEEGAFANNGSKTSCLNEVSECFIVSSESKPLDTTVVIFRALVS